uniref:Uncharacterized protein n=1 Tax=Arundo donax TaxID=35708 RepID=A0A0A8Z8T4_ARUDO
MAAMIVRSKLEGGTRSSTATSGEGGTHNRGMGRKGGRG